MLIAHRGYSAKYPENTMVSFRNARCKVIEFDVRKTRDNVAVVMHDSTLDRTTTGTGAIKNHTWEEIQQVSIQKSAERVPSLDQVLREFGDEYAYDIEIKSTDTARVVVDSILRSGVSLDHVLITSFKWGEIDAVRRLDDRISTGLISFARSERAIRECAKKRCKVVVLNYRCVDTSIIRYAVERGIEVYAFTVNDAKEIQKLINYGCTGVITDEQF
jgi:glycerophosphoryl diester phosphodiesterase